VQLLELGGVAPVAPAATRLVLDTQNESLPITAAEQPWTKTQRVQQSNRKQRPTGVMC